MRLDRERKTLKILSSVHGGSCSLLAKLICAGQDKDWLRLVMPSCLGGDLNVLLDQAAFPTQHHPSSTGTSTFANTLVKCG